MEKENRELLDAFNHHSTSTVINSISLRVAKNADVSKSIRLEGNSYFQTKPHNSLSHEEIWLKYCISIAVAPISSEEQALGYGNRSAFLFHISKFSDCMKDIDRAVSITNSNNLKIKLLCRKIKCLKAIGLPGIEKTVQKVQYYINKCDENDKQSQLNLIKEAEKYHFSQNIKKDDHKSNYIPLKKKKNDFSSVSINFNNEHGHHLIAKKSINPGEVIFIEKPYVSILTAQKAHAFCSHCFIICWSMIPCDSCSWCMFCSEKCKTEAWEQYHQIECAAYGNVIKTNLDDNLHIQICIRALILSIKDAGSINDLKTDLENLDKNKENFLMNSFNNTNFMRNGFKNLYSLSGIVTSVAQSKMTALLAINILISFAKYTTIFGKKLMPEECWHMIYTNTDALFVGSLILRLLRISFTCAHKIFNRHVHSENLYSSIYNVANYNSYSHRGLSISILASLTKHSCNPNAHRCYTKNNCVIYALQPIKKGAQIFESHFSTFYEMPNLIRKNMLKEVFGFECMCEPCRKEWPALLKIRAYQGNMNNKALEVKLMKNFKSLLIDVETNDENTEYSEKMILDLSRGIIKATKRLSQPNLVTFELISSLKKVFERLYGNRLYVPNRCI